MPTSGCQADTLNASTLVQVLSLNCSKHVAAILRQFWLRCAHSLGDALALPAFELAGQQVAEPPLQQWYDATQEEQPDTPHGRPEAHTRPLAYWACVEAVVHQMLQVLQQRRMHLDQHPADADTTMDIPASFTNNLQCNHTTLNCPLVLANHHAAFVQDSDLFLLALTQFSAMTCQHEKATPG